MDLKTTKKWYKLHIKEQLSNSEIAKKYGVHKETIRRAFEKYGFINQNYHNRIKHNQNKFSSIKIEEDAYWLGFILADGYVSDKNRFSVCLQKKDYKHLEKLRKYLDLKLTVKQDHFRCRLSYNNKILVDNLKNLGVTPRKSLTLKFPKNKVPKHLMRHFIRGYFDGDGCISYYRVQRKTKVSRVVNWSVLGTKNFLDEIRRNLPVELGKYINNNKKETTLVLFSAHKKARIIIDWLYSNSNIYLERKFKIYERINSKYKPTKHI